MVYVPESVTNDTKVRCHRFWPIAIFQATSQRRLKVLNHIRPCLLITRSKLYLDSFSVADRVYMYCSVARSFWVLNVVTYVCEGQGARSCSELLLYIAHGLEIG